MNWNNAPESLQKGGVGVIPTDTLYGLVGSALASETVERIYAIKGRDAAKPLIILISSFDDLEIFKIALDKNNREFLMRAWPAQLSVILPVSSREYEYLHPLQGTLAFRMPDNNELLSLLKAVGPLVVPSANPQGEKPAVTIEEARTYFGDKVDFYVDGGRLDSKPSTLVDLTKGKPIVIRQGTVKVFQTLAETRH